MKKTLLCLCLALCLSGCIVAPGGYGYYDHGFYHGPVFHGHFRR